MFDPAVFFGAFLGPIFAILLFNIVIFALVIRVVIKHTRNKLDRTKQQMDMKTTIRLLIGIANLLFILGLTWLFGALTVTGFGSAAASNAFQVLFVLCNAFQGFFIFLFFCVLTKEGRESWLQLLTCGRYKSKSVFPPQAKNKSSSSNAAQKKIKTSSTGLADSKLTSAISSQTGFNLSIDPLRSTSEQQKLSVVTFNNPEDHEMNVSTDKKVGLQSSEVKEKEQALERSNNSEEYASSHQCKEDGMELKAHVKHHV